MISTVSEAQREAWAAMSRRGMSPYRIARAEGVHDFTVRRWLRKDGVIPPERTPERGVVSTNELLDVTGATYRQVDYWCRRGFIPGQERRPGSGQPRVWTWEQVARVQGLCAASELIEKGLPAVAEAIDAGWR